MIPVDAIHMSLKVNYIFIAMTFTNMRVWFGRLDIFPDGEHRIMIRLCKTLALLMCKCYNNLECLCKCYIKE